MNDRTRRYLIRGIILAALLSAIVAEVAARLQMSHTRSGEYIALVVFLPLLVVPGGFIWKQTKRRLLAAWSVWGWVATTIWHLVGYRVDAYPVVHIATWISIAIVTLVAGVASLLLRR